MLRYSFIILVIFFGMFFFECPAVFADPPITITSCQELQNINNNLDGKYFLSRDINCSGFPFVPIGKVAQKPFTGQLDGGQGQSRSIFNLTSSSPSLVPYDPAEINGLFAYLSPTAVVKNFDLQGHFLGGYIVGAVAAISEGTISNVNVSGTTRGYISSPALANGEFYGGFVGGLVGISSGVVENSHSQSTTSNGISSGGLVGWNQGLILRSNANGTVSSLGSTGGLVGLNDGKIDQSYALTTVNLSGAAIAGGLVGVNAGSISESYSTGTATNTTGKGGLVGDNLDVGQVSNSYWDSVTSGVAAGTLGTPRTTAQMKQQATFVGWNFVTEWEIPAGQYPRSRYKDLTSSFVGPSSSNQYYPSISGNGVVWNQKDGASPNTIANGKGDIYYYTFATQKVTRITNTASVYGKPCIDNDKIVWADTRKNDGTSDIYLYNLTTQQEEKIIDLGANPRVSGDSLIFTRGQAVYLKDLRSLTLPATIFSAISVNSEPFIVNVGSRYIVVSNDDGSSRRQIQVHEIGRGIIATVPKLPADNDDMQGISGNKVVFLRGNDIYVFDIVSRVVTRVTNDAVVQSNATISNNKIVWAEGADLTLFYSDLANPTVKQPLGERLASGAGGPVIYGDRVVWVDGSVLNSLKLKARDLNASRPMVKLKMNVTGTGMGAVRTYPNALNCPTSAGVGDICEATFERGTWVKLQFLPSDDAVLSSFDLALPVNTNQIIRPFATAVLNEDGQVNVVFTRITKIVWTELLNVPLNPVSRGSSLQLSLRLTNTTPFDSPSRAVTVSLLRGLPLVNNVTVTLPAVGRKQGANPTVVDFTVNVPISLTTVAGSYRLLLEGLSRQQPLVTVQNRRFNLRVQIWGNGSPGTFVSTPAGMNCSSTGTGADCRADLEEGMVTLTPQPGAEAQFAVWNSGSEICTNADKDVKCVINMNGPKEITGSFGPFTASARGEVKNIQNSAPINPTSLVFRSARGFDVSATVGGGNYMTAANSLPSGSYTVMAAGYQDQSVVFNKAESVSGVWTKNLSLTPRVTTATMQGNIGWLTSQIPLSPDIQTGSYICKWFVSWGYPYATNVSSVAMSSGNRWAFSMDSGFTQSTGTQRMGSTITCSQ